MNKKSKMSLATGTSPNKQQEDTTTQASSSFQKAGLPKHPLLVGYILEVVVDYINDLKDIKFCREVCKVWNKEFEKKFLARTNVVAKFTPKRTYKCLKEVFDPNNPDALKHTSIDFRSLYVFVSMRFQKWMLEYGSNLTSIILGHKACAHVYRFGSWRHTFRLLLTTWCPNLEDLTIHGVFPDVDQTRLGNPHAQVEVYEPTGQRAKLKKLILCHYNIYSESSQTTYAAPMLNEIFLSIDRIDMLRLELKDSVHINTFLDELKIPRRIVQNLQELQLKGFYLQGDRHLSRAQRKHYRNGKERLGPDELVCMYTLWGETPKIRIECRGMPHYELRGAPKLTDLSLTIEQTSNHTPHLDFLLDTPSIKKCEVIWEPYNHYRKVEWPKPTAHLIRKHNESLQELKLQNCTGIKLDMIIPPILNLKTLTYDIRSDEKYFVNNLLAAFSHPTLEDLRITLIINSDDLNKIVQDLTALPRACFVSNKLEKILIKGTPEMMAFPMYEILGEAFQYAPRLKFLTFKDFKFFSDEYEPITELASVHEQTKFRFIQCSFDN